jgi:hypothetical protein
LNFAWKPGFHVVYMYVYRVSMRVYWVSIHGLKFHEALNSAIFSVSTWCSSLVSVIFCPISRIVSPLNVNNPLLFSNQSTRAIPVCTWATRLWLQAAMPGNDGCYAELFHGPPAQCRHPWATVGTFPLSMTARWVCHFYHLRNFFWSANFMAKKLRKESGSLKPCEAYCWF